MKNGETKIKTENRKNQLTELQTQMMAPQHEALIEAEAQLGLLQLANQANRKKLVHERKVLELKRGQIERTQQLLKKLPMLC